MARNIIQDDRELLQMSQTELKKLQRQYRIMEGDDNSYAFEIKCHINKQRKIIETLRNEEESLKSKIFFKRPTSAPELSHQWEKNFEELLTTYEKQLHRIKQKKDTIVNLNKKIKSLESENKVLSFYGDVKTIRMNKNAEKSTKQVQLLQNKLHIETVKYDKILTENASMRQELDSLLKSRLRFNDQYRKLVMKLNADKKKLAVLVEKATAACEQRDEADEKLKLSQNKDHQETVAYKHKMTELNEQLNHLIQLKEFITIKVQKRILVDLEKQRNERKQEKLQLMENFMKNHSRILEQLKDFCDEEDADRLPVIFVKQEEENFAFFNYVNEINNEVETLHDEVKTLVADLEQQRKLNIHFKNEQIDCFDLCKNQLEEMKKLYEKDEEEFDFTTNVLNTMLKEMCNVFTLFKNNTSSLIQLLGDSDISSSNVNLFLDIMGKKIEKFTDAR